jgi:hypothetical protein
MHAPLKPLETPVLADASAVATRPIGALRAFLTLLVIAHHTVLTYHPYAPAPKAFTAQPILWTAFPVVDPQKFGGLRPADPGQRPVLHVADVPGLGSVRRRKLEGQGARAAS